ncbi:MAG: PAS domain-containing protein [Kiritimatiellaeota bacterium]|nr:PAS domain-containing protein [Kiritimatiellota bacterium]
MRRPKTVFRVLAYPFIAVVVLTAGASLWFSTNAVRRFYYDETRDELRALAEIAAKELPARIEASGVENADAFCKDTARRIAHRRTRFTVVRLDGRVVGDSERDPAEMVNHADRPEIRQALRSLSYGTRVRYSTTLHMPMMYVAVPLYVHKRLFGVVRASRPLQRIGRAVRALMLDLALGGATAAAACAVIALLFTRRVSAPLQDMREGAEELAHGRLDVRLAEPDIIEVALAVRAMNTMAERLQTYLRDLRRERNELDAVLRGMAEGVVALDDEGRIVLINDAACRMLGIPASDVRGKTLFECTRIAGLARVLDQLRAGPGEVRSEVEVPGEKQRILNVHAGVLARESGAGAVLVFSDVTDLRRLEQVRKDFVANVSHELRTPLTSLRGYIETLRDGAIDRPEDARPFLEVLDRQTSRLQAIVEDLLLLSRLERDEAEGRIDRREGPLLPLIRDAVCAVQPQAEAAGVALQVQCPENLRADVAAGLIRQAVVNLLDNAVKYSPAGSRVDIEVDAHADEIVLRVRDCGCGIPRRHLSRIFERFYRVDKARSRDRGGTGLGLSIVKHIARLHGGRVTVESVPGSGSTFAIILPRCGGMTRHKQG